VDYNHIIIYADGSQGVRFSVVFVCLAVNPHHISNQSIKIYFLSKNRWS